MSSRKSLYEDLEIFRIYEDGTEGTVTSLSELREHAEKGGLFGVEKAAWEAFYERTADKVQEETKATPELPQEEDTFSIYQLKRGDETTDLRFEPYDRLTAAGYTVDMANYDLIYTADLAPGTSLEDIYTRFNVDHPKDFKGHSLSVSDVVVLHQNGQDIVERMKQLEVPNSPNKTHFMVQLSPAFMQLASSRDTERLAALLPYQSLVLSSLKDRHGIYAQVNRDENRDREIKKPRQSIRAQLKADKAKTAPKKAAKTKNHELEV